MCSVRDMKINTVAVALYRAMHYSAKCGIEIACLSVCLSVTDDSGSQPYVANL